jgi:hypothetical protein
MVTPGHVTRSRFGGIRLRRARIGGMLVWSGWKTADS